ncbi:MAG: helix-turn-helix transcriptional regulator [Bacteroidota bacterium]
MKKNHTTSRALPGRIPTKAFHLQQIEDIYIQAQGRADEAHRHDYYTVLLVEEGRGQHIIDYRSYAFAPGQVYFVSPGQVHQVLFEAQPKGWVITFSKDFLIKNNITTHFIANFNLFRQFGEAPPLILDEVSQERLLRIIEEMNACLLPQLHYQKEALGALLQLFLIYCSNSCLLDTKQLDESNAGICILRDFKQLVDHKYREWHKVTNYATEIHITAKHLSQTVKTLTGKTAKVLIQDRIILEAKRLLLHSSLTIKEIAFQLGFEEPLHFSAFFKKMTQTAPSQFRLQT